MPVGGISRVSGVIENNEGDVLVPDSTIHGYPFRPRSPNIITFYSLAAYVMSGNAIVVGLGHFGNDSIGVGKLSRLFRRVLKFTCQSNTQYPLLIIGKRHIGKCGQMDIEFNRRITFIVHLKNVSRIFSQQTVSLWPLP